MTTTRTKDSKVEQAVAQLMDSWFYSKVAAKLSCDFERVTDFTEQIQGIDVKLGKMRIDEKCKYRGLRNSFIQYPSVEISFVNRTGYVQDGWFICQNSHTTHYNFIGVQTTAQDDYSIDSTNVTGLSCMLYSKTDLVDYLALQNIDMHRLSEDAKELRKSPDDRLRYNGCWLKCSRQLYEKPVNLVFPLKTLLDLPRTKMFYIAKDHIRKIV